MLRHGQTEDNIVKIYSRDDTKLTPLGRKQIKSIKKHIEELSFSKAYYSPLARTRQTLSELEIKGLVEERVREIDFGIFTGKDYKTIEKTNPLESKMWLEDPIRYIIPQGESLELVYNRLKEFLDELVKEDESVLLVVHEGIIRLVCCWVFDNVDYFFKFKAENASISIVTIKEGYKYISKLNYNPNL